MKMKWIGLILAAICYILGLTLQIEGLSHEGGVALFTLLAGVCMWICGTFPVAVSGLLCMLLLILANVGSASVVVAGFMNTAVLFLIFCFAFGTVFKKTTASKKLVGWILNLCKGKSKRVVAGILFASCILSYFMHNLAVIAIMLPIAASILEALGHEKMKSNLGKCLMIGLALAAMVGGAGSPIGASFNVLVGTMFESMTGEAINFGQWCAVAIPLTLVCTWALYFSLTRFFKPETLDDSQVEALMKQFSDIPAMTKREIAMLVTMLAAIVLMVLGTWIPILSIINVGLLFLIVATLPGVDFLTWKEIEEDTNWGILVMYGSINALVAMLISTGAVDWLSAVITGSLSGLPAIAALLLIGLITQILHGLCPTGPALAAVLFAPFAAVAAATGFPVATVVLILAFSLGVQYIVPTTLPLVITMGTGYWQPKDMILPGILPAVVMIILMAVWLPFGLTLVGF